MCNNHAPKYFLKNESIINYKTKQLDKNNFLYYIPVYG